MSDPTTDEPDPEIADAIRLLMASTGREMPPMSDTERLGRAFCRAAMIHQIETGQFGNITREELEEAVDREWSEYIKPMHQFVREMLEPSEGMVDAMQRGFHLGEDPKVALRDALINGLCFIETEGKTVRIPMEGEVR